MMLLNNNENMTSKKKSILRGNGFRTLLFFLLLYILGAPFLEPYPSLAVFAHISLSMALFAAVYTVHKQNRKRSIAISLLIPLIILYWLGIYDIIAFSRLGGILLFTAYYGLLVYSFVAQIKRAHRVDINVLYATFSLYLIIGLFWGSLYMLLDQLHPGSYEGVLLANPQYMDHVFNYFSFVTLTTLGY
jgi:voltage-gated potassium channel